MWSESVTAGWSEALSVLQMDQPLPSAAARQTFEFSSRVTALYVLVRMSARRITVFAEPTKYHVFRVSAGFFDRGVTGTCQFFSVFLFQ